MEIMEANDIYTKDGTVNHRNNPADKRRTGTWKASLYILGNKCCERVACYAMSSNLVIYFTQQLNQHTATASRNLSNWSGTCYIMPLLGAFLADAYLGRYWTIASFSIIHVIGMTLLTLSASVPGLKPTCTAKDVCHATDAQQIICFIALYLVAIGIGGLMPCVSSYGADQFDDADENEKHSKGSFFNWVYFSMNVGLIVGSSLPVYIQIHVGWEWGFGIAAAASAIGAVSFFSGTRIYRYQKPGGSPLTRLCQVLVASFRKHKVTLPADKSLLHEAQGEESAIVGSRKLEHTNAFSFFDKAAVVTENDFKNGLSIDRWRLCTVTQVEELKSIIKLLPIWATGIIFSAVFGQIGNLFVSQSTFMDTHVGNTKFKIPESSLIVFNGMGVLVCVPIYDRIITPFARKFTGHRNGLSQLQRMGIGLFISVIAMVFAAVLEIVRLGIVRRHDIYDVKEVPISVFWQVPQYFIIGCAEVFTFIGQLEFFYEQAPDSMRSLCSALSLTTTALGNYLSTLLVLIVTNLSTKGGKPGWIPDNLNYGHLHYFYLLLAGLCALNLGAFIVVAKKYAYKRTIGTLP